MAVGRRIARDELRRSARRADDLHAVAVRAAMQAFHDRWANFAAWWRYVQRAAPHEMPTEPFEAAIRKYHEVAGT